MEQNILVRTLGDSHFLKVLGFFLEHPVHGYSISKISKYLGISRDTVKKDLDFYEALGYIERASRRGPYRLRLGDGMVETLLQFVLDVTRTLGEEGAPAYSDRLYIPRLPFGSRPLRRACLAGA